MVRGIKAITQGAVNVNKKCGKCEWHTDKCKNPDNPNFGEFKDNDDRCTVNVKRKYSDKTIYGYR